MKGKKEREKIRKAKLCSECFLLRRHSIFSPLSLHSLPPPPLSLSPFSFSTRIKLYSSKIEALRFRGSPEFTGIRGKPRVEGSGWTVVGGTAVVMLAVMVPPVGRRRQGLLREPWALEGLVLHPRLGWWRMELGEVEDERRPFDLHCIHC